MVLPEVAVSKLTPTVALPEQPFNTLSHMIGALAPSLLDQTFTEESVSSHPPTLESSLAESEVVSGMVSYASSVKYPPSTTPATHLDRPPDTVEFVKYGPDGQVHAGTLSGLIQVLVDPNGHRKDKEVFLALYRMFTTGEKVLSPLIEQFNAALSSHTAELSRHAPWILLVLELWQEFDFLAPTDVGLFRTMRDFVQSLPTASFFSLRARQLVASINKNLALFETPTPPITPPSSSFRPSDTRAPGERRPRDLAEVLTSIEGDRYRKLRGFDYVGWLEDDHESDAVASFFSLNKNLTRWAERFILKPRDQSHRGENLKYLLQVIKECKLLHNFSSACALSAGITTKAITDLKRTYGDLDKSHQRLFLQANQLISVKNNFKAYRTALKESGNACIPWIYVHLIYDLKIIHRAPKFDDKDGHKNLINFMRCRRVHRQILKIREYQPPALEQSNPALHSKLLPLIDAQLNDMPNNQQHYEWVRIRGDKVASEEKEDYKNYVKELHGAGFDTRRLQNSIHRPTRRPSVIPEALINNAEGPLSAGYPPGYPPYSGLPNATTPTAGRPEIVERQTSLRNHPQEQRRSTRDTIQNGMPSTSSTQPQPSENSSTTTDNDSRPRPLDIFKRDSKRCLDGRIIRPDSHQTTCGGNADIWIGWLDGYPVAIKCIRRFSSNGRQLGDDKLLKRLWREYAAWEQLSHPNVLECLGFTYDHSTGPSSLPSLISPWMSNGTLSDYIKHHPEVDRLKLLLDVAHGLSYLHSKTIIHGDIRGSNILISDTGRPCISDFGLSKVLMLEGYTTATSPGGSMRWMSPELFQGDYAPDVKSDVWAYAMTVLEIMSGRYPYSDVKPDVAAMKQICQGQLPQRSSPPNIDHPNTDHPNTDHPNTDHPNTDHPEVSDDVWAICQKCWNFVARQRPSMQEVYDELAAL